MPDHNLSRELFGNENWQIVGYGERGTTNWETERQIDIADLVWITEVVVKSGREGQEPDYFTLHGPWDDPEDLSGHIEDEADHYGQSSE